MKMKPTEEPYLATGGLPPIETVENAGQMTHVPPIAVTNRREPPVNPNDTQATQFPLDRLPAWAGWQALDLAEPYCLTPASLVAASLTVVGGLLGPALQIAGLEDYPTHPVIHTQLIMPPSPLARRQYAKQLLPVWAVLDRQARLKDQPRMSDSFDPSSAERQFGRHANPANKSIPRENPLDRLGAKPGLLACSPDREHIRLQAARSLDRHLLSDGTGARFGGDLLDLSQKEWASLLASLDAGFHRGLLQPEKHSARLTAFWTLDHREAQLIWARMARGGRRPPPFLVLHAGAEEAKLSATKLAEKPKHVDQWHRWCESILRYRTGASSLPVRTFSRRARAGLVDFHNQLLDLEKNNPVARRSGIGHFVALAERIAGLFSIVGDDAEIRADDVSLALRLARYFLRLHLEALEGMVDTSATFVGSPRSRGRSLDEALLDKIAASEEGLSVRDLARTFHRGPDTATIRLTLQRLEVEGRIEWRDDETVGASAPTDGDDGAPAPKGDCEPLTGADTLPATLEPPPAL